MREVEVSQIPQLYASMRTLRAMYEFGHSHMSNLISAMRKSPWKAGVVGTGKGMRINTQMFDAFWRDWAKKH
nr:MAG TPA: hypothetical protein [Caudoviricetes sp.]